VDPITCTNAVTQRKISAPAGKCKFANNKTPNKWMHKIFLPL